MNGLVDRRSVVSAVTIVAIAPLTTYVFPATATTYKGAELVP
jgi:hypothetical protein